MDLDFSRELDNFNFTAELTETERAETLARLQELNPEQPNRAIEIQEWDIKEFSKPHLPVIIGALKNPKLFSDWADDLATGVTTDLENRRIRTLDLAIHMPGQGWHIPAFLRQFEEAIMLAIKAEKAVNSRANNRFVHITIDQKMVPPDKPGRRPGLHTDVGLRDEHGKQLDVIAEHRAIIAKQRGVSDHAYVMHDVLPTGFYPGPFPMTNETGAAIPSFEEQAIGQTMSSYPNYSLLRLNAYDIHTATLNDIGQEVRRTFFKIQFTERLLDREVNTQNPHFDYDRARQVNNSADLTSEEAKLLELLNTRGYRYFQELIFSDERVFDDAQREARSNLRLAISYAFEAKIHIVEKALGHSLPATKRGEESSRLASLETDQEETIQLGLILQVMRTTPNHGSDEWKQLVTQAAIKAVGKDTEKWSDTVRVKEKDRSQFIE